MTAAQRTQLGSAVAVAVVLALLDARGAAVQDRNAYTSWTDYGGSSDGLQYSALKQINKKNVAKLEPAWSYPVPGPSGRFGFNPVIVDGVMYVLGKDRTIVALDAATGQHIWSHPVEGNPTDRGINYWESKDRRHRRLIFAANSYLQQIDALTGVTVNTFGNDGKVDLRIGLDRDPKTLRNVQTGTPGRTWENLILVGAATGEGYGSAPGHIRAYDVLSGKLVWTFRTIPLPGEFGYDTWPKDAYKYAGGANVWGEMAIDEKRGIGYFPTGSPTYDFYGADRKGSNLFGNCLLALDLRTGKRLWHFQVVHHDLWDYDLTTSPKLLTVRHNARPVDVVVQATKFGFIYVFDRVTGKPLWPIEERPVPKSDVPGEEAWPTQPFPLKPPPYARQRFTVDSVNPHVDPADRERLLATLREARNEGLFTPPALRNTIIMPGELGGTNWGGVAADPRTGWLYVRSNDAPTMHIMSQRQPQRPVTAGTPQQQGSAYYSQLCGTCHGPNRVALTPPTELGVEKFKAIVRTGRGQMPGFAEATLPPAGMDALITFLSTAPPVAEHGGPPAAVPARSVPPDGQVRYYTPYGTLNANNGLPAIGPPWSQLTAYDLNEGTIKWQVPFGKVTSLAEKGIADTGSYHPTRNGVVVTAGGLIFAGTWSDRTVRAYDKDTGQVLWERELESNPEGIPSVYEVAGRQYVVFCARTGRVFDNIGAESMAWSKGKPEAQGYYVFALPADLGLGGNR